jgi:hypothetical protein
MKKIYLLFVLLFSFIIITLSSCNKSVENKIEGTWQRINVIHANSTEFEYWTFSGGYLYVTQTGTLGSDTLSYGNYNVDAGLFKKHLIISGSTNTTINNEWVIDKLTSKTLVLDRNEGQAYIEFTK